MRGNAKINPFIGPYVVSLFSFLALLAWAGASGAGGAEPTRPELEQRFAGTVRPFLQAYCVSCHGKEKPQAQLDLTAYTSMLSVARDYPHWSLALEKLTAKQ